MRTQSRPPNSAWRVAGGGEETSPHGVIHKLRRRPHRAEGQTEPKGSEENQKAGQGRGSVPELEPSPRMLRLATQITKETGC